MKLYIFNVYLQLFFIGNRQYATDSALVAFNPDQVRFKNQRLASTSSDVPIDLRSFFPIHMLICPVELSVDLM